MDPELLDQLIDRGSEQRHVEFKEDQPWLTLKFALIRACLSMANIRDGGWIIVGVREVGPDRVKATGVSEKNLATFSQDTVMEAVGKYADPFVALDVAKVELDSRTFVVIRVEEFAQVPVITKKGHDKNIKHPAIYTRNRKKVQSAIVASGADLREIMDLAVEKGIRRFVETASKAGVEVTPEDTNPYDEEVGSFLD